MRPENSYFLNNFNTWLVGSHGGIPNCLDWFPVDEEVAKGLDSDDKAVTMIDVGGGMGHELLALKKEYPELPGRLVLPRSSGKYQRRPRDYSVRGHRA